jgi:PAS domain S-box-containing protein
VPIKPVFGQLQRLLSWSPRAIREEIDQAWFDAHRAMMVLGAFLYLGWHWILDTLPFPDPLWERVVIFLALMALWWSYPRVTWLKVRFRSINLIVFTLLTLHTAWLAARQGNPPVFVLLLATASLPILIAQPTLVHFGAFAAISTLVIHHAAIASQLEVHFIMASWLTVATCSALFLILRMRTDLQFVESRRKTEALVKQLPVGILQLDLEGNIVAFNERAPEIFGKTSAEFASWKSYEILGTDLQPLPTEQVPSVIAAREQKEVFARTLGIREKGSDEIIWMQVNAAPLISESGLLEGTLSTFEDITYQRRMQEDLVQARAMAAHASRLAAVGEMAGGIAHEINNPLAIVSGRAQQLEALLSENGWLNEQVIKILDSLQSTTKRMGYIIHGLLTFARDKGENQPFESVSVTKLLDDLQSLCRERFRNHGISLQVADIPAEWLVDCRPVQIVQILMNLLNNAHDAVWKKDSIDASGSVSLRVLSIDQGYAFEVEDSGNGVPPHAVNRIFQPFFTTKAVGQGTGLGLSVSRSIAKAHRGRLELKSTKPSVFLLWIPQKQTATTPSQSEAIQGTLK